MKKNILLKIKKDLIKKRTANIHKSNENVRYFVSGTQVKNMFLHIVLNFTKSSIALNALSLSKKSGNYIGALKRGMTNGEKEVMYILMLNEGEKSIYRYLKLNSLLKVFSVETHIELQKNLESETQKYAELYDMFETEDYFTVYGDVLIKVPKEHLNNFDKYLSEILNNNKNKKLIRVIK